MTKELDAHESKIESMAQVFYDTYRNHVCTRKNKHELWLVSLRASKIILENLKVDKLGGV